jgi:type VI secretion system protein ImpC
VAKSWDLRIGGINLTAGSTGDTGHVDPEAPFRILLLGNFAAAGRASTKPLAQRKPMLVDRDNVDEVLARLGTQVRVPLGPNPQETITLSFREVEDFGPDRLFRNLEIFETLGDLRRRLNDPSRSAAAAAEIKGWSSAGAPEPAPTPPPIPQENLLEQILGEGTPQTETSESDWRRFLNKIVDPYLVAPSDPRLADFEAAVDEAISAQMRTILHHPEFQAAEAAWRSLAFLVRRLETDSKLKLYLLDVSREELAADLLGAFDLTQTVLYRQIVEPSVGIQGGQPWAVLAGLSTFGPAHPELELLGNLGQLARAAGAPFLAAAHPSLVGCPSLVRQPDPREWTPGEEQQAWRQLRQMPQAAYLGLAVPRFLLRLPYGKEGSTTDVFAFEEMPPGSPHDNYLWGNPALACAALLGQSFSQSGWDLHPGQLTTLDGLPVHVHEEDGERQTKPCAEVLLSNRALERLLDAGLMTFISERDRDAIRLARFQSIASPAAALAGRWQ